MPANLSFFRGRLSCLLLTCLALSSSAAFAQQVTASITGVVTDPSGAVLPDASITAVSVERGTQYTAQTNNDGRYLISNVVTGTYNVKVEKPGFQSAEQKGIVLQLNQIAKLDFPLQVGNVSTTLEVTGEPPVLQTESTQIGQVIDARTNVTLPLATRNYVQLTLLAPGSTHPDPSSMTSGQTTASSGRPYVNGNREQANNFILDGMDNNQVSDNLVGYAPSVDAIEEFNEITQNAPAEFGNFMGAIVSTQIKSGSNSFHGDAFEFFRNDVLNANTWSNNFLGLQKAKLRWNEFGGTVGGPIVKDKLFFFVDYQGSRFDTPTSSSSISVLTPLERTGNFSQLPSTIQLHDPKTGIAYRNNVIPQNQLDPVALKIVNSSAYPTPTGPGFLNNYSYTNHTANNNDQGDARVDYNMSEKNRIFGRFSHSYVDNPSTNTMPLLYNSFANYPVYNGVIDWVSTVSPTILNDARVGVNYVLVNNGASSNGLANFNQTVGLPGVPSSILPAMNFSGGNVSNFGNSDVYQLFGDTVIQYEDTLVINKGVHTMHIGFQGWRYRVDTFYSGNNGLAGTFNFNGQYSGLAEADFLLGLPSNIGAGVQGGTWGQRSNVFGAFYQDDWHVTPNLTLNLGLRYELHTPWIEVHNRQTNFGLLTGAIEIAGQNGNSRALYNQYDGITNFQPRIGVAWNVQPKTVIRAAYTLSSYLEGTGTNLRLTINPPFAHEQDADYSALKYPSSTLQQGFLPFQGAVGDPYAGATLRVWDPNVRPAVSNQWNFTIQHQLPGQTTLQAGYVGQKTTHLMVPMPYLQRQMLGNGQTAPSIFLSGNPALQSDIGQISGTASNGNQSYNALQAVLQKRLTNGLEYNVAYTYSKCMTDSSGYYGSWGGQTTPTSPYWQNLYNRKAEWGPCYYDVKHVLTAYATYDLPIGRNRAIGKNLNKFADAVVGGWQANAILTLHSGYPLTISAPDASGTNSRGSRANCLNPVHILGKQNSPQGGYQWFDPSAFGPETPGQFGTCGVGTVRGPGLHTVDFALDKFFNITESKRIEFRGEAINLTNTPILNSPSAGLGTQLGLIQSSQGARNIQFALKFLF